MVASRDTQDHTSCEEKVATVSAGKIVLAWSGLVWYRTGFAAALVKENSLGSGKLRPGCGGGSATYGNAAPREGRVAQVQTTPQSCRAPGQSHYQDCGKNLILYQQTPSRFHWKTEAQAMLQTFSKTIYSTSWASSNFKGSVFAFLGHQDWTL